MAESDDETYTVPLRDQRVFGAGIKKQRVNFVPSSTSLSATTPSTPSSGSSIADRYLSIVLAKGTEPERSHSAPPPATETTDTPAPLCDVCNLPLQPGSHAAPHEASLAHQVCLEHSHPPSAIDRSRKGLSFLQAYGWDPDKRVGLGAGGEGMLHPIQVKEKRDTVGLGANVKPGKGPVVKQKVQKLNAKEVRKKEEEGRKRSEKLKKMFYANDDVEKYLGFLG